MGPLCFCSEDCLHIITTRHMLAKLTKQMQLCLAKLQCLVLTLRIHWENCCKLCTLAFFLASLQNIERQDSSFLQSAGQGIQTWTTTRRRSDQHQQK